MMVQWRQETIQTIGTIQTNSTQMMNIIFSNVWEIPEFPSDISFLIVAMSISALAVLGITKFKWNRAKN
jgi:hypothetical protein